MMKRIAITGVLLLSAVVVATTGNCPSYEAQKGSAEWRVFELKNRILYQAIRSVESSDGRDTVNRAEGAYGDVQIRQIAVDQLNQCYNTDAFLLEYAFDDEWSYIFFTLTMAAYNPEMDFEKGARIWNGGVCGHLQPSTIPYWGKVRSKLLSAGYAV